MDSGLSEANGRMSRDGAVGDRVARILFSRQLIFVLLGLGTVLRIAQYASNRSIWFDEALIALNLMDRPLSGLTGTLDFNQGAPLGFLFIEHFMTSAFGFSEYVLRLFPLVAGIASLFLFAALAKRVLVALAVPLALFLFVVADQLIYYSSEVKPYSGDVAVSLLLLLLAIVLAERPLTRTRALGVSAAGGICVLLSNAAVFVVAAVGLVLIIEAVALSRWADLRSRVSTISLWVVGAIGAIVFAVTRLSHVRESLGGGGNGAFLGTPNSSSWMDLYWVKRLGTDLAAAIGFSQSQPYAQIEKLAAAVAVVGILSLFLRNKTRCAMLLLPFGLTLIASALDRYPLSLRTTLFLAPLVVLFIAEGLVRVTTRIRPPWGSIAGVFLATLILAFPAWSAVRHLVRPQEKEEIKPVLRYVRDHWRSGDTLYVHPSAQYALRYYVECGCLRLVRRHDRRPLWPLNAASGGVDQHAVALRSRSPDVIVGRYHGTQLDRYLTDLGLLRGRPRVWVLSSHADDEREVTFLTRDVPRYLDSIGRRLEEADATGARAYLYDLR
jgi:uncharacterized membrane protein